MDGILLLGAAIGALLFAVMMAAVALVSVYIVVSNVITRIRE